MAQAVRRSEAWLADQLARQKAPPAVYIPPPKVTPKRDRKYGNEPVDGFDSKLEAKRAGELALLQRAGAITDLKLQPVFELIPKQVDKDGKCLERRLTYRADFSYVDGEGCLVTEDAKGCKTDVYRIKRKLMLALLGIRVVEV